MILQRSALLAFSLSALLGASVSPPAQAQNTVIHLNYGAGQTCDFSTQGISISGASASVIDTQPNGHFDFANSDCPTGGGQTGAASVSLLASPTAINTNGTSHISWSATADACRYDGSSLPGALAGWQTSGYACVGAAECQAGADYNPSFSIGGNYLLKLTCVSGGQNGQPATQAFKTVSVQVDGGGPEPGNCVAPTGLTQQLTGTVSKSSGGVVRNGVDVTQWDPVYGYNITTQESEPWPGVFNTSPKLYVNRGQYWSMAFTVPANYPFYNSSSLFPYGKFSTNSSNVTPDLDWTVSISDACGDFIRPASPSPTYGCYQTYGPAQGGGLSWVVTPVSAPISGVCNLQRGKTYYLNVAPGPLGSDHSTACSGSTCTINLKSTGSF